MRKFGRTGVVLMAMAGMFVLNQGTAQALETYCWAEDGDAGGVSCQIWHEADGQHVDSVKFDAYGEHLTIYDLVEDGKGVMAEVNGQPYWGAPSAYGPIEFNLSIAEGTKVTLTSCQTNNGSVYDCASRTATA
ncbi:hypothetical protein AB0M28_07290 [Streptomyces sp. NPDC051940]|uniref:hypothetical protein n=1 Tax=Streptomyces sp. NPDC051940 TaxID=3155675 RepID=UPI003429CA51